MQQSSQGTGSGRKLHASEPTEAFAERGELVFGDRRLLLFNLANGSSDLADYKEYLASRKQIC